MQFVEKLKPWWDKMLALIERARPGIRRAGLWSRGRLLWLWGQLLHFVRVAVPKIRRFVGTLRRGPSPWLDEDLGEGGFAAEASVVESAERLADGSRVRTIVPTSRWDHLDAPPSALSPRARTYVVTVAVAGTALLAVLLLRSGGEADPGAGEGWSEDGVMALEAAPLGHIDSPGQASAGGLFGGFGRETGGATGFAGSGSLAALLPGRRAVPQAGAVPVSGAWEEDDDDADDVDDVVEVWAPPAPAPAPSVSSKPAPVTPPAPPRVAPAVPRDEAARLAQRAGCPEGTLATRVLPGDTVRTIAWRHAPTAARSLVPKILEANTNLRPERMQPGDLVCVPEVDRVIVDYERTAYTIQRGDTITKLAVQFEHLSRANVLAITAPARRKDMLFAGVTVEVPVPRYTER